MAARAAHPRHCQQPASCFSSGYNRVIRGDPSFPTWGPPDTSPGVTPPSSRHPPSGLGLPELCARAPGLPRGTWDGQRAPPQAVAAPTAAPGASPELGESTPVSLGGSELEGRCRTGMQGRDAPACPWTSS